MLALDSTYKPVYFAVVLKVDAAAEAVAIQEANHLGEAHRFSMHSVLEFVLMLASNQVACSPPLCW